MNVFVRILNILPLLSSGTSLEKIEARDLAACQKLSFLCNSQEFSTLCEKTSQNNSYLQGLRSTCVEISPDFAKESLFDAALLTRFLNSGDCFSKPPTNAKEVVNSFSDFYRNYVFSVQNPTLSIERLGVCLLIYDFFNERYGTPPPSLCKNERGKPFFADFPLEVSVSHSDALVCCAFAEKGDFTEKSLSVECGAFAEDSAPAEDAVSAKSSPSSFFLGLDAQLVPSEEKHYSLRQIAEKLFKNDAFYAELSGISSPKEFCDAFTLLWTKKESLVKMTGEGLGGIKKAPPIPYRQISYSLVTDGGKRKYYVSLSLNATFEL